MDPLRRKAVYTDAATDLGFGSSRKRIDHPALTRALRQHYRDFEGYQHRDRLMSTTTHPSRWISDIFERPFRSSHPVCHLLLIGFLFRSIEAFQQSMAQSASPNMQHIPSSIPDTPHGKIDLDSDNAHAILRDTSRSCRAVAQILGLSVTTVVTRRRALQLPIAERPKYLRHDALARLNTALVNGLPPKLIAQQQGVSLSTVYRLRQHILPLASQSNSLAAMRQQDRQRALWQQTMAQYGHAGSRMVRNQAAATYMWLYRHDREWLRQHGRLPPVPVQQPLRIDWQARDRELCSRLQQHVAFMQADPNRPRLSQSCLYRYLGEAMLRRYLKHLPGLKLMLQEHAESLQAFQCFRITRAVQQLSTQGTAPTLWRIQRVAGIKNFTDTLRAHAVCEIQKMGDLRSHL